MSAPPTPPAGAPSSAPSPGSAAASPPLRIDTEESWNRANAWLGSKDSATSPVASEVKRLLNLAFSRWEQPGAAAPLVVEACRLAGLDPVPGDEIVARPAPTPPTPIPLGQPAPTTPPAPIQPAPTTQPAPGTQPAPTTPPAPVNPPAQPAQPAPTPAPATRGNIIAGGIIAASIIAVVAGIASIGLAVGADAIRAAAAGGIIAVVAVIAVRAAAQGGGAGITAAMCTAGLAAGITAGVMKGGDVNIAALTIGSIVGTAIAVATTGSGKKMLEMARFAISSATGSNKSQH